MGLVSILVDLVRSPGVNPVNMKARALPILNPFNVYGRVFFFSWFGFMMAFWAWFAFPPLLTTTIVKDLDLTAAQVANSNIISICATMLVRFIAGPLCDQFGPRKVFAGCLLLGSIPIGLAPLVQNAGGLYTSRLFIGILGGSFVPCQVWTTGFFDKNIVGRANAIAGGWGNAGGGLTYFIMPAVYDSFVGYGYPADQAWRLTFILPLIMLIVTGLGLLLLCPDTPTGRWSRRELHVQEENIAALDDGVGARGPIVAVPGPTTDRPSTCSMTTLETVNDRPDQSTRPTRDPSSSRRGEGAEASETDLAAHQDEIIINPSVAEILKVTLCPQTCTLMLCYACSFGAELSINAVLAAYYLASFPYLGQTRAAHWAAMFGFLNLAARPLGGIIADALFNHPAPSGSPTRALWLKKAWLHLCGVLAGVLLIITGTADVGSLPTFNGLVALAAVFLEAGNGANYALVPHVHPYANGVVSGLTGGFGNLGGVVFAIIFRFMDDGTGYAKAFWVIGCIHVGVNLLVAWIPPIPRGQAGGH
ncbi:nitrate transporter [Cryphonectria parasitica EP155]|uniref:Nitrate/nitrite transporter n=1 Tax=Cryphonectria parasitica (strain ATCC 38755 / EP155) TaxID=660469 RepID=A0A9P5CLX5_CRYP1|nr:nitrate transporter [Cryphonectria parasitica EP155]KAF3762501.1 nitrate transporter [Cryphonectria parasitica EP155]